MANTLKARAVQAERRKEFIADAESSAAEVDAGGPLYAAKDVHAYILARSTGKTARRPQPVRRSRGR